MTPPNPCEHGRQPTAYVQTTSLIGFWLAHIRIPERVLLGFFSYTALLCIVSNVEIWQRAVSVALPLALFSLAYAATCRAGKRVDWIRPWLVPAAVLGAYWQMGWFARSHDVGWATAWIAIDRQLLDNWGLRTLAERRFPFLPWLLELGYLLLYLIPLIGIWFIWRKRAQSQVDQFLVVFALGTLAAYALLPFIAVQSPRLAFPGEDLPRAHGVWRSINLWILDHLDISTSVFPSGHVAVAFSSAFGIRRALPASRAFWGFLAAAFLVFAATIYGRYHYAADGVASIFICLIMWGLCEGYDRLA